MGAATLAIPEDNPDAAYHNDNCYKYKEENGTDPRFSITLVFLAIVCRAKSTRIATLFTLDLIKGRFLVVLVYG